ncbi:MAG: hypothetical protein KKF67_02565 [Nanoarchaeota archaeon]|nr:hypothetical protein [Nanoarchaeota archaeon]
MDVKKKNWFKEHPVLTGIIGVVILFVIIGMFSGGDNNTSTNTQSNKNTGGNSDSEPSAIEMMEVAFIGGYSQGEIKTLIDATMQLNSLPITEENYQRLGSVLVTLRKEIGVSEMDILTCMKAADYRNSVGGDITPEKAVTDSAAICATLLA